MTLPPMKHPAANPRRGSILIEAVVGAMILGVAMAMLVPGLSGVRRQRQAVRFEILAMVELNNIAEFLPSLKPIAVDAANHKDLVFEQTPELSPWFAARYANAQLTADILPTVEGEVLNGLRGIRLTIHRPAFEAMPDQKVSVVVWQKTQETTP